MTHGRAAEALPRATRLVGWPKHVFFFFLFFFFSLLSIWLIREALNCMAPLSVLTCSWTSLRYSSVHLTQSLTQSLTHALIRTLSHALDRSLTHSLTHSPAYPLVC